MKVYRCKICGATRSRDGEVFTADSNPLAKQRILLHIAITHKKTPADSDIETVNTS
jgi:hypothetical protein